MKSYSINFLIFFLLSFFAQSQSNEFQIRANLNNLSFGGPGASYITSIHTPVNEPNSSFVANPYGNHGKIAYGLVINYQRNTKSRLLFGISSSYELLRSKMVTYIHLFMKTSALREVERMY